jgi:hypothetical protein
MKGVRLLFPLVILLAVSCNFPMPAGRIPATATDGTAGGTSAGSASTPIRTAIVPRPTADWTGGTYRVETEDLLVNYPDFIDPDAARKHADALQKAYEVYLGIFDFGDGWPYGGEKLSLIWNPKASSSTVGANSMIMGSGALRILAEEDLNPPDEIFFHEMLHVFEEAEVKAGRYYIFNLIIGINEAFAEYLECHPSVYLLWDRGSSTKAYCDLLLYDIGDKSTAMTLAYYETEKIDPYGLDWGLHPAGGSGEVYFRQMLARISDMAGWDLWENYFSMTKDSDGSPIAKAVYLNEPLMKSGPDFRAPEVKKAFSEFVSDLSKAAGRDFGPVFRGWRFEL